MAIGTRLNCGVDLSGACDDIRGEFLEFSTIHFRSTLDRTPTWANAAPEALTYRRGSFWKRDETPVFQASAMGYFFNCGETGEKTLKVRPSTLEFPA